MYMYICVCVCVHVCVCVLVCVYACMRAHARAHTLACTMEPVWDQTTAVVSLSPSRGLWARHSCLSGTQGEHLHPLSHLTGPKLSHQKHMQNLKTKEPSAPAFQNVPCHNSKHAQHVYIEQLSAEVMKMQ